MGPVTLRYLGRLRQATITESEWFTDDPRHPEGYEMLHVQFAEPIELLPGEFITQTYFSRQTLDKFKEL